MSTSTAVEFTCRIIDPEGPGNPHIKTAGDLDGDGRTDLVVASSNGGPLVWYRAPKWTKHLIAPTGAWSTDAKLVDMDGDGDLDVLISDWYTHNRLEWYENPLPSGDPARDPWKHHVIGQPRAHDIQVGDVDADGGMEIVTRSQGSQGDHFIIWKRKPDGKWTQREIACPAGEGLALGEISGAGRLDVVIGGSWYEAPSDIMNGPWEARAFADWPVDTVVAVADMNQNGRNDVVLTRSEGPHRLSWFEAPPNPQDAAWAEHIVEASLDFAHSLVICDLDGDGNLDIATAEMHQSQRKRILIYLNEENGQRWTRQVLATSGMHKLCAGDTTGHGRIDLMGANWSGPNQAVELWENHAPSGGVAVS